MNHFEIHCDKFEKNRLIDINLYYIIYQHRYFCFLQSKIVSMRLSQQALMRYAVVWFIREKNRKRVHETVSNDVNGDNHCVPSQASQSMIMTPVQPIYIAIITHYIIIIQKRFKSKVAVRSDMPRSKCVMTLPSERCRVVVSTGRKPKRL